MSKVDAYGKALGLLNKIQSRVDLISERLNVVGRESGETADRLAAFQGASPIAAKNQTDAMYVLKTSTQAAFDKAAKCNDELIVAIQKLNERISQVESQNLIIAREHHKFRADLEALLVQAKTVAELKAAIRLFLQ